MIEEIGRSFTKKISAVNNLDYCARVINVKFVFAASSEALHHHLDVYLFHGPGF